MITSVPAIPTIPEVSLANRNDQSAAAKIAVFAYHRESRVPVWQSGVKTARSTAKDMWILGAGPIQRGSIYDGVQFAGNRLRIPFLQREDTSPGLPDHYASTQEFVAPETIEQKLADAKRAAEEKAVAAAKAAADAKALADSLAAAKAEADASKAAASHVQQAGHEQ